MLSVSGLAALIVLGMGYYVMRHMDMTPRQFVLYGMGQAGIDAGWVRRVFTPSPAIVQREFDGFLRKGHPRILFPDLADAGTEARMAAMALRNSAYERNGIHAPDACGGKGIMARAACWFLTNDRGAAEAAIAGMLAKEVAQPNPSGQYGNGWQLAFAYDLVANYEGFDNTDKTLVRDKIQRALRDYLVLLNDNSPSLWHGRTTLAAQAWLCAVVLDREIPERRDLVHQAQAHFLNVIRGLELTEAWPEGYNYWINSRAYILALASVAYLNGLEQAKRSEEIRTALTRTGLWHLYAVRPDNRIEALGDEGPRVDLKDETRRVIDLFALATGNPLFARFSRYVEQLHGRESYYRGYRWGFRLLNDPSLAWVKASEEGGLEDLGRQLPKAELFGERALNLAYIRSGWGRDDTFISFRAGASFTHHGHYDAGHFSLFKGAPLAITSGTYGDYFSDHRLHYAIRTVAKNSLLILRPDETVRPNRFFKRNVAAGGQRIVLPSGSAIRSPHHWSENQGDGLHLEGGRLLAFHNEEGQYAYIAADLTRAYNNPLHDEGGFGGKVKKVVRELIYLYPEDRLLIHDRVVATDGEYKKKWLLHTVTRPEIEGLRMLKGTQENGIGESNAKVARVSNGRGRLHLDALYPEDGEMRLIGGPDYRYYVETDGDDSDLDGDNMSNGSQERPWFESGEWRIEWQPSGARILDHFLVALSPSLDEFREERVLPLSLPEGEARGAVTPENLVIFTRESGRGGLNIEYGGGKKGLYLLGLLPLATLSLSNGSQSVTADVNDAGAAYLDMEALQPGRLEIRW